MKRTHVPQRKTHPEMHDNVGIQELELRTRELFTNAS